MEDYHNKKTAGDSGVVHPVIPDDNLRIIVGITCSLSIVGALLIIFSFACFKKLRTTTRLVLVHISVMDFGVAGANLVGIAVDFDQYYFDPVHGNYTPSGWPILKDPNKAVVALCKTQAAVAVFSTTGSILWTLCMSVYIYFRIVHHNTPNVARTVLWVVTILCYVIPTVFVLWTVLTGRLGYSPYNSEGWCGVAMVDVVTGQKHIVFAIIGYDLWICLTYFLVPILYLSVLLYVRQELKRSAMFVSSERFWSAVHNLDFKLLLIPVAFLLLRIWSFIEAIVYIYMGQHLPDGLHHWMVYLSGIGDSGQGFVNAILFIVLAKKVRSTLFAFVCCRKVYHMDDGSQLILGGSPDEHEKLYCPRENTPHLFTSSHGSSITDASTEYTSTYGSSTNA